MNFVYVTSDDGKIYCFGVSFSPPVPIFTWNPQNPEPDETITFDASQSYDPDGTITQYQWDWNNDGNYDENHTTPTTTHTYTQPGSYQVTLKVTDNEGAYNTLTKNIYIGNIPPSADFIWTPQNPEPGETITFDASQSYDPDGTITPIPMGLEQRWKLRRKPHNTHNNTHIHTTRIIPSNTKSNRQRRSIQYFNKKYIYSSHTTHSYL